MKRREFLRATAYAGAAWLPLNRTWASDQPARSLDRHRDQSAQIEHRRISPRACRASCFCRPMRVTSRRAESGTAPSTSVPRSSRRALGAADVMRAVNFAREHKLLTAVRAGGHSTSGKSTCDGGIMIDLSPMRGVRVDPALARRISSPARCSASWIVKAPRSASPPRPAPFRTPAPPASRSAAASAASAAASASPATT